MSVQDQYTDTIRHTQETLTASIASLTDNVSKAFETSGTPFTSLDPAVAVDQVFDYWSTALDLQRDVAKQLVSATVSATEQMRSQVESFSTVTHDEA